jgi:hypothetical protein
LERFGFSPVHPQDYFSWNQPQAVQSRNYDGIVFKGKGEGEKNGNKATSSNLTSRLAKLVGNMGIHMKTWLQMTCLTLALAGAAVGQANLFWRNKHTRSAAVEEYDGRRDRGPLHQLGIWVSLQGGG